MMPGVLLSKMKKSWSIVALLVAAVIAAILIGSAMIIMASVPPLLFGISVLGLFGFLVAGALGAWLVISILLSRRL